MTTGSHGTAAEGDPRVIGSPEQLRLALQASFSVSAQQWAAICAPLEPAVVIAGAGSGKTTLMAARVVYLVANRLVRPDQVLGLTFTTKAAAELRHQVNEALAKAGLDAHEVLDAPTVTTYNAYASRLLTEHGLRIGHEPDTRVMAEGARFQLAARAVSRHRGAIRLLSDHPETVIRYILALDAELNEHLVTPDEVRTHDRAVLAEVEAELPGSRAKTDLKALVSVLHRRAELLGLVEEYRALKHRWGLIDFSDQIALVARLAQQHPDVGQTERETYRVVLLDEYQDTSVAQARLLSRLFSGADPASGRGHPVMAVGDPNQAIYGWRGASVSNIIGFGRDFPAAQLLREQLLHQQGAEGEGATGSIDAGGVRAYRLTINRRSDRRILEIANRLAQPLLRAAPVVAPLEAPADAASGAVETIVHETYADELTWLAEEVAACHAAGTPWGEIGVLTKDNAHAADVFDTLSQAQIPVEIVGLRGLLALPEVGEVVATLRLLLDLTQNAALLRLLTGPRWAIGPRDLGLLGRRARELVHNRFGRARPDDLGVELRQAVAGADPAEIVALGDALESPGELPYSDSARARFALLSAELRGLRAHVGEPLVDLVRRIIDVTGIDVELASSPSPAARARRDNLDLFVSAVAEFQAIDGEVTLPALVGYLEAEDEQGTGLDVATPTAADSVKLLTVHRAKGLEYDAVFLPGVCADRFPNLKRRSQWTTTPQVLPIPLRGDAIDLPRLPAVTAAGLKRFAEEVSAHQATEELRLGYVAFTRAKHLLWVSSYLWHPNRTTPVGPSPYQELVRDSIIAWGQAPRAWLDRPEKGTPSPLSGAAVQAPWPVTTRSAEARIRQEAAARVLGLIEQPSPPSETAAPDAPLFDLFDQALVEEWDRELDRLLVEASRGPDEQLEVQLPTSVSASAMLRWSAAPDDFIEELVRPMPAQPSPAARFGTRFHAWVEQRFGQQDLFEAEELPGRGDAGIDDDADLAALIDAFEAGPFGERIPQALEQPFALHLAGQIIRGRIDAVYANPDGTYSVVDWKTGRHESADPMQLALYRLAWAELHGLPVERVRAAFYYVRTSRVVEPPGLPGRNGLEEWVSRARSSDEGSEPSGR
ncbi:MAG: ATP-dependent DNA helicase [Nocardioides sp.]